MARKNNKGLRNTRDILKSKKPNNRWGKRMMNELKRLKGGEADENGKI